MIVNRIRSQTMGYIDEAYFIFYNETAYWIAQAFKIIKQSIQRKVTPKIFALLSPQ